MIKAVLGYALSGLPIVLGLYWALDIYFNKFFNLKDIKGFFLDKEYTRKLEIIGRIEKREKQNLISLILKDYIDQYERENDIDWDIWP